VTTGKRRGAVWAFGVVAVLFVAGSRGTKAQAVSAIPQLDVTRFSGVWYEVAHFPNKHQKRCAGNDQMLFALGDKANHIQLVNSCKTKAGYTDAKNVDGKAQDKLGDGRLKLGFWPLYRKYWVLATEPDYQWSLVGSPNHKDLWIYSRKSSVTPEVMAEIRAKASSQGFAVEKLVTVPQGLE
jgi:apolipoprotein D and lipocalin family protein